MRNWWRKLIGKEPVKRSYFDKAGDVIVSHVGQGGKISVSTENSAMKLDVVFRCISILSGSVASMSINRLMKVGKHFSIREDDPFNYVFNVRANEVLTGYQLWSNVVTDMVNNGNAYVLPVYYGAELDSLVLLSRGSVSHDKVARTYTINDYTNGIREVVKPEDILHFRNVSIDGGHTGISTISYAAHTLGIYASANNRSHTSFQDGETYAGFISGDDGGEVVGVGQLQDEQLETVADRVTVELKSGKKIMYLPGNMKFNPLSMSPADMQLLETKKLGTLEICRFFGVHPDKVFAGQTQNYKASEMGEVMFLGDTLRPILRNIEAELTAKFIPRSLYTKYKIKFDIESLLQTDLTTMASYMEKTIQNGIYTVNEWRIKQDMPPVEGGDTPMISCNVAPIDSAKIKGENSAE